MRTQPKHKDRDTQASREGLHRDQQYPHLGRKAQGRESRAGTWYRTQEGCLVGFLEEADPELDIGDGSPAWDWERVLG